MARNHWLQLGVLSWVPLLMVLGNSMLIPILPAMGRAMGLSKATTGLTITFFSLAAGAGIAFAGYAADRWGRKRVIIPAVLMYGLGAAIAGFGGIFLGRGAFPVVMAGRVIQGLGAAGTAPVAMAFVGDLFEGGGRVTALGIFEASNGFGKLISPFIGALLGIFFLWWVPFFGFALLSIPVAAMVLFFTKEEKQPKATPIKEYLHSVKEILKKEGISLAAALWIGTVALTVLFALLFYLSQHLEDEHGIDGLPKAVWLAGPVGSMCLTSFLTGLLLQKKPAIGKFIIGGGLALTLAGLLLMAFIRADWALITGCVALGIGTGLQLPGLNDQVTGSAPPEQRGMVTALYSAVRFFGVAFGPPIVGILMSRSERLPFWAAAGMVATAAIALFACGKAKEKPKSDQRVEDVEEDEEEFAFHRPPGVPPWRPPTKI